MTQLKTMEALIRTRKLVAMTLLKKKPFIQRIVSSDEAATIYDSLQQSGHLTAIIQFAGGQ